MADNKMYHKPTESGYWTSTNYFGVEVRNKFGFTNIREESKPIPIGILEQDGELYMIFNTVEGDRSININQIPGVTPIRGDSGTYEHEVDGELLLEFTYFNPNGQLEDKPRRVRPTGIMFGIMGETIKDPQGSRHRSDGESADFYLVGEHTIHPPEVAERNFPFWRIRGIYGEPIDQKTEYMFEDRGGRD